MRSRAADVVAGWGLEPVPDHARTLRTWHKTWQENESFERRILGEDRGHHLEMRALRRDFKLKYQAKVESTSFYIEALESALNQKALDSMRESERLQMMLADFESDKLRQMARNPGGDRGYAGVIEKFVKQRPRFTLDAH